jgi:hypothetical protein
MARPSRRLCGFDSVENRSTPRWGDGDPIVRPMLTGALILLLLAALAGSWLAILHFAGRTPERTPWPVAALHAVLALGGFALLLIALIGPPRPAGGGTQGFGAAAALLFGLAALFGGGIFLRFRYRRTSAAGLVGVHATLAVFGIAILAAYVLAG